MFNLYSSELWVPIAVGDASSPHRFKFVKNSQDSNGAGWTHRFTFFTERTLRNGAKTFSVGYAHNPHRFRIFDQPNPTRQTIAGWSYKFEFYAYSSKKAGTIPYAVGDAGNPHRFIVFPNSNYASKNGWTHRFVFWAYPKQRGKT